MRAPRVDREEDPEQLSGDLGNSGGKHEGVMHSLRFEGRLLQAGAQILHGQFEQAPSFRHSHKDEIEDECKGHDVLHSVVARLASSTGASVRADVGQPDVADLRKNLAGISCNNLAQELSARRTSCSSWQGSPWGSRSTSKGSSSCSSRASSKRCSRDMPRVSCGSRGRDHRRKLKRCNRETKCLQFQRARQQPPRKNRQWATQERAGSDFQIGLETLSETGASRPSSGYSTGGAATWRRKMEIRDTLKLPCLDRLCGRCNPQLPTAPATMFPDHKRKNQFFQEFIQNVANMRMNEKDDMLPKMLPHWGGDCSEIKLPSLPPKSVFSRNPHRKFRMLTSAEAFSLEAKVLQQKLKSPAIGEEVKNSGGLSKEEVADFHQGLMVATLRWAVGKSIKDRTANEEFFIIEYLKGKPFFKGLPLAILQKICRQFRFQRYEEDEVVCKQGSQVDHVLFILKGSCGFKERLEPTKRESYVPFDSKEWRGAAGLGVSPLLRENDITDTRVIGLWDLLVPYSSPPEARTDQLHSRTVIASSALETLLVTASSLVALLEAEATIERLRIIREDFPLTKTWTTVDCYSASRVEMDGRRLLVYELFKVSDVRKQTTFWMQGDKPDIDDAKVVLLLDGIAQLKNKKGVVLDVVSGGTLLGVEAVRAEPYRCTINVSSDRARIMYISASDFLSQFLPGRMRLPASQDAADKLSQDISAAFHKVPDSIMNVGMRQNKRTIHPLSLLKVKTMFVRKALHKQRFEETIVESEVAATELYPTGRDSVSHSTIGSFMRTTAELQSTPGDQDLLLPSPSQQVGRSSDHADLFQRPSRLKDDRKDILQLEWQKLMPKRLPKRIGPPGSYVHRFGTDLFAELPPRRFKRRSLEEKLAASKGLALCDQHMRVGQGIRSLLPMHTSNTLAPAPKIEAPWVQRALDKNAFVGQIEVKIIPP